MQARVRDHEGASDTADFSITLTGANDDPVIDVSNAAQASLLVHGVRFTALEAGTDGNDLRVEFLIGSISQVTRSGNTISFTFSSNNTQITSQEIIDLWDDWANLALKTSIVLALEGTAATDTLSNLVALNAQAFTGGTAGSANAITDTANSGTTATTAGDFGVTDLDQGEYEGGARAPGYTVITGTGSNAATVSAATGTAPNLSYTVTKGGVTWGTLALNTATGAWTFTTNASTVNTLNADEAEILSLQARVTDAAGGTDTASFTITINGANDDPVLTNVVDRAITDTANSGATASVSGNFGVTDLDNGEQEGGSRAPTYSLLGVGAGTDAASISGSAPTWSVSHAGQTWGTFNLNAATGAWTFTTHANAVNTLHAGEVERLQLRARVTDAEGGVDTETFTITITGANDDPVLTGVVDRSVDDTANSANNQPTASGNFGVTDADNNEGEGGSRAPTYTILTGTGSDAATAATSDTGTNRTYTITKGGVDLGDDHAEYQYRRLDLHR